MKANTQTLAAQALSLLENSLRGNDYNDADIAYVELALLELLRKRYDK